MTDCVQMVEDVARVTKDAVLSAIRSYVDVQAKDFFTTLDIARHMGVEEYPVRAAVSWLNRYRYIEIVPGVRSKRYLPMNGNRRLHGNEYSVSVYQIRETTPADFDTLNRVFCGR